MNSVFAQYEELPSPQFAVINLSLRLRLITANFGLDNSSYRAQPHSIIVNNCTPLNQSDCSNFVMYIIKEIIRQSGIKDLFGGHSVRGASTSSVKQAGLSIDMILDMADWTSTSTFNRSVLL